MKMIVISFVAGMLLMLPAMAQPLTSDLVAGTSHSIDSKVLGESRQIQVHLPSNYDESGKAYPVLYLIDGQRFFLHAAGLTASFRQYDLTPEFIVVGIVNTYPRRFQHLGDGRVEFLSFIEKELMPFVDQTYRTTSGRMLFGWEYGGGFVFHTFTTRPDLFSYYMMASPYPIADKLKDLDHSDMGGKTLYFSVSPNEFEVNRGVNKLDSALSAAKYDGLDWTYQKLANEEHRSTGYPTLYHGLRKYFQYYPELQVDDLAQFVEAGGLDYAFDYTRQRADAYGFANELSLWTKFTIVRSAIRAEDFAHFQTFYEELGRMQLIGELMENNRSYGALSIGEFFHDNGGYQEAAEIYKILLEESPNSEKVLTRMVAACLALDRKKEAKKYTELLKNIKEQ